MENCSSHASAVTPFTRRQSPLQMRSSLKTSLVFIAASVPTSVTPITFATAVLPSCSLYVMCTTNMKNSLLATCPAEKGKARGRSRLRRHTEGRGRTLPSFRIERDADDPISRTWAPRISTHVPGKIDEKVSAVAPHTVTAKVTLAFLSRHVKRTMGDTPFRASSSSPPGLDSSSLPLFFPPPIRRRATSCMCVTPSSLNTPEIRSTFDLAK
mmetsp:Transcript_13931/g.35902  ORF Transcript_13931/g.35902 Transcript_13931/m.35902 type:complete len:212 (-) Transcript_13931:459-1094(-)